MMIPADVTADIAAKFPGAKLHLHESKFTSGFGVEIDVDGEIQRNGWQIRDAGDWPDVKNKALAWLMSRFPF
jgi:hypothetical protein